MTTSENQDEDDGNRALSRFEQSLAELEELVETLESGDLGLEESLRKFERGVSLARDCQTALRTAELRVRQLTDNGEEIEAADRPDDA